VQPRSATSGVPRGPDAARGRVVPISNATPVWDRFFTVAPLILVATREGDGFDIAPKHMATPDGWENLYGFVCTPRHATYRNALAHGAFTVSFPRAKQIVQAGLAAAGRLDDSSKPALAALPLCPPHGSTASSSRDVRPSWSASWTG
jgi:hypothetical protein